MLGSASNNTDCQARHAHSLSGESVCQGRGNGAASHPGWDMQCSVPGIFTINKTQDVQHEPHDHLSVVTLLWGRARSLQSRCRDCLRMKIFPGYRQLDKPPPGPG